MFSGIVEGTGTVVSIHRNRSGARLVIRSSFSLSSTKIGASVAVNGCCLTVTRKGKDRFEADLSYETLRVTNLGSVKPGDLVNLERPLRLSDRVDGHLVQGHVDGVGWISGRRRHGDSLEFEVRYPKGLRRYLIPKGSVAVDGISMTVNRLMARSFTLVVIPHTLQKTNFKAKRAGDPVNLEVDMVAKYIEKFIRQR